MVTRFPDSRAPGQMAPWIRRMQDAVTELERISARSANVSGNGKTAADQSMGLLQTQVGALQDTVAQVVTQQATLTAQQAALEAAQSSLQGAQASIVAQQNYINSLQPISAASAAGLTAVSQGSWAGNAYRPTVNITTSSTRIKITVGATLLSGLGVYSISGGATVTRESRVSGIEAIAALANYSNTNGIGAERSFFVNVPKGVNLSVAAEFYANLSGTQVGYPTISVQNVG